MALFRNFYRCARCQHQWTDVWSATCDDDCPNCGARHMSPYKSEDAEPEGDEDDSQDEAPTDTQQDAIATEKKERIRELNDAFRQTFAGGRVVITPNVVALPDMVKANRYGQSERPA